MPRHHLAAAAVLGALALPASASAAALTTDLPCYVAGTPGTVSLSGFAPNAMVTLQNAELGAITVTTDATGSSAQPFTLPSPQGVGSRDVVFTATEVANPASTAMVGTKIASLAFRTSTGVKSPNSKRAWYFSGFAVGKPIYAHFRFGGKTKANFRMGVATGPCGEYKRQAEGIAVKGSARSGTWTIAVDQSPTFSVGTKPQLKDKSVVYTTVRRRSAPGMSAASLTTAALNGWYRFRGF